MQTRAAYEVTRRMKGINISGNIVARLAGVSTGECSERLSGKRPLDGELAQRFLRLMDRLEDLQSLHRAQINWSDTERISALLKEREEAKQFHQMLVES